MLRRAVDEHRAVFLRHRVRDHPLEVELLLSADVDSPGEAMRRRCDRARGIAPLHALGRQHERLGADRGLRREDWLLVLVLDDREARGATRLFNGMRGDCEDRLAEILDERGREDRVVGDDGAVVVLARHILRREHRDDARRGADLREVDRLDPRVRALAQADRRVERPADFRNVVGVERPAADVQMRAVVGDRCACAAGRMLCHARRPGIRPRILRPASRTWRRRSRARIGRAGCARRSSGTRPSPACRSRACSRRRARPWPRAPSPRSNRAR